MIGALLRTIKDNSKTVVGENDGGRAMSVAGVAALKHRQRRKIRSKDEKVIIDVKNLN